MHSHRGCGGHRNRWSVRFEGDRNEYRTGWAERFRVRLATRERGQANDEYSDAPAQALSFYPGRSLESVIDRIDLEAVPKERTSGTAVRKMLLGVPIHMIFEAIQPILTDPDKIYTGQELRIPQAWP